ncbi:MAG: hypothetical protein NC122_08975 [Faecalibacterium sp.]|nr:hypothetical protein [Ruminococcus sp.]MCM1392843.1 hypothetical protein [Ruminococcus sp.]MCM1486327.1 hypothetical protein [Faecalibacterium sp.]
MLIPTLLFAIVSWVLAIFASIKKNQYIPFIISSFSSCCVSTLFQLIDIQQRSRVGDFAGIDDTIMATILIVAAVMIITIVLNSVALVVNRNKGDDDEKN